MGTGRIQGSVWRPGDALEIIATVINTDEGTEEDGRALGPQHAIILRFMQSKIPPLLCFRYSKLGTCCLHRVATRGQC